MSRLSLTSSLIIIDRHHPHPHHHHDHHHQHHPRRPPRRRRRRRHRHHRHHRHRHHGVRSRLLRTLRAESFIKPSPSVGTHLLQNNTHPLAIAEPLIDCFSFPHR